MGGDGDEVDLWVGRCLRASVPMDATNADTLSNGRFLNGTERLVRLFPVGIEVDGEVG